MWTVRGLAAVAALMLFASGQPLARRVTAATSETLAVIANTANPINSLTSTQLRDLFLARQTTWPNGRRVTLVLRQGTSERAAVIRLCCDMSADEYERHMLRAVFAGELVSGPKMVSSADAVKRFVFNVPGALGAVPIDDLDATVRIVRIDGHLPREAGYRLVLP
jgi:hypothetical protein